MFETKDDGPSNQLKQPRAKLVYFPPTLLEFGSIAKLTQTGAGSGTDGGTGTMQMMCL